ncbi:MAG: gliding motility-associated C-terminal domain-containing protein, partial [Flavobacteriaceae bacterium]
VISADLSIDKNISDTTPNTGDTVTFTIDIVNNGPDSATNVSLEDVVPQGYTINTGSISNGGTLAGNTISWDIANVPAGTLQLSYTATVNAPTGTAGEYRNVVQVTASDQFDPDSTPNNDDGDQSEDDEDSTQDVGVNAANLSVEKGIIGTAPNVGDTVTFYIRLLNDGPNEATGIIIEDLLPSGYTLDQTSISHGGNYASNVITWNIASLLAGELVLTYDAVVNPPVGTAGEYTNVAQVTASDQFDPNSTPDNYDPNMPNEDDEAEYTLPSMEADINIVKTVSPAMARLGDTVTFTVSVENQGAITATNITVEDSLPNGYSLNSLDTSHGTFDPTLDSWDIPALTAGEIATLTMEVTVVEGTDYTNVATLVAMDQLDPNPSNDMSEAEVTIEEEDCLLVFNEFSPNGDGANEVFFIQCIDHYPNNHLKIFNRWGNLVYEKHGYNNDWDGTSYGRATMRAEEKLPVGTYYYILDLGESGSDLEPKTGWLYITR